MFEKKTPHIISVDSIQKLCDIKPPKKLPPSISVKSNTLGDFKLDEEILCGAAINDNIVENNVFKDDDTKIKIDPDKIKWL
jgi:hypothetical protein